MKTKYTIHDERFAKKKHIEQIAEHRWLTRTSIVPRLRARSKAAFTLASSWRHAAISERICFILIFSSLTHRIHVWYIYTYIWLIFMVNVGKYTIHGLFGLWSSLLWPLPPFCLETSLNQPGNHNQSSTSQVATDAAPPQFLTSAATISRTLVLQQEKLLLYPGNS